MKKILLIVICIVSLQFGVDAQQKTYIPDTAVRNWIKAELNWEISYLNANWLAQYGWGYTKQCFMGDTLLLDSLYAHQTTFSLYYSSNNGGQYHYYGINLSNRNIRNMEGLQYFSNFYYINLSHNLIDSLGYRNVSTSNPDPVFLNLNNNLLSGSVNKYLNWDFYSINLDSNYFTSFNSIPLGNNDKLRILSLSGNLITSFNIAEKSYGSLNNINLSNNKISSASIVDYTPSSFSGGDVSINLSHNLLTHIPKISPREWYGGSQRYSTLDFSYNNITTIDSNAIDIDPTSTYGTYSSPGVLIGSMNLSHNNINNTSSNALIRLTNQGKHLIGIIDLSYNNLNSSPELYENITDYNCSHNNIYCLPKLPSTLQNLIIDANKTTCIPNAGYFTLNGNSSVAYPVCNATNNANGCKGFPTITGSIYLDKNSNGIKDAGENTMQNIPIHLTNGAIVYSDNNGRFSVSATDTGSHTIRIVAPKYHTAFPDSITINFTRYDTTANIGNIGIRLTTVIDSLAITATPINWAARPGFNYPVKVNYKNVGTTTLSSSTISLSYNNTQLIFDSCSNASAVNSSSSISFNIANLGAGEEGNAIAYFRINPTATIGDTIKLMSTITANATTAQDETFAIVRGSFDPNEKDATPTLTTTQVALGKYIDYTVHFQNTGNDTAFTVVIADTLNSKLQVNSLQVITSSHNCKTTLNGNKIYFEFLNILLPDSNVNLLGSNGFVRFRIKPINTLVAGSIVPNNASIYFDYNKPILTNTATTQVITPVVTPVKIMSYELRMMSERQVLNSWTTATEVNLSHYNVQRSIDGRSFETIGQVQGGKNIYEFIDKKLPTTNEKLTMYYRLQAMDKDGQTGYSSTKQITINSKPQTIAIYPNPTKDFITIDSKGMKSLTITDCFGRTIQQFNNINEHQTINTKQWSRGIYILSFDNGERVKVVRE